MKLLIVLCFVLVSAAAIQRPHFDLKKARQYFDDFVKQYNKRYDRDELVSRLQTFKENLKSINVLNAMNRTVFGITQFADLSASEFAAICKCSGAASKIRRRSRNTCSTVTDRQLRSVDPPQELDYRDRGCVTPAKNQGTCLSCWAFTTVGVLEGAHCLAHNELLTLSPMQLMSCLPSSGNCTDRGNWQDMALEDLLQTDGVMEEHDYPYENADAACEYDKEMARVKVTSCSTFKLSDDDYLRRALYQRGPLGVSYNSAPLQFYVSGVIDADICPPNTDHASLLVGYGTAWNTGTDYWLIKNSWGPYWGEDGYVRIAKDGNACGINSEFVVAASVA